MERHRSLREIEADPAPNRRYDHVWAIIRIDPTVPDGFAVKVILRNREAAEHETHRLNRVNAGKRARYLCRLTRLERLQ